MADQHTISYFDGKKLSRFVFEDCLEPTEADLTAMLKGDTVELISGSADAPESFIGYRIDRFAGEETEDGALTESTLEANRLYTRSCKDISVATERVFDFIEPFIGLDLLYLVTGTPEYSGQAADEVNNAAVNARLLTFSGRYENHVFTPSELTELIKGNEIYFEYVSSSGDWVRLSGRLFPSGIAETAEGSQERTVTARFFPVDEYPELPSAGADQY